MAVDGVIVCRYRVQHDRVDEWFLCCMIVGKLRESTVLAPPLDLLMLENDRPANEDVVFLGDLEKFDL